MPITMLATQVAGTPATSTEVAFSPADATPWMPGRVVTAVITSGTATGTAPSYIIEGSDTAADSGYTTLLESTGFGPKLANVVLKRWMRFRIATAGGTAGAGLSAWLVADAG